jgi:hypothetical protein
MEKQNFIKTPQFLAIITNKNNPDDRTIYEVVNVKCGDDFIVRITDIRGHLLDFDLLEWDVEISSKLESYYFTFGSANYFPHKKTYLEVIADSKKSAVEKFRKKYPDHFKDVVNCSEIYSEESWEDLDGPKYYPGDPVEVIF